MQRYAVFYKLSPSHDRILGQRHYQGVLGSDGIMYLDGRWSMDTCHEKITEHVTKSKLLSDKIDGYRIARGPIGRPLFLTAAVKPIYKG
jgi:hypothetical protein